MSIEEARAAAIAARGRDIAESGEYWPRDRFGTDGAEGTIDAPYGQWDPLDADDDDDDDGMCANCSARPAAAGGCMCDVCNAKHPSPNGADIDSPIPPGPPTLAHDLLTRALLFDLPDPEPLIDGVIDQGTVGLLYGMWGSGKSFIALDWAASVAAGRPWQGRPTEKRPVLYVAAEGAYGLKGRINAWEQGWHHNLIHTAFHILPHPVNLTDFVEVAQMMHLVQWGGYGLVIFDTLARCMVGADENSAKDCGVVVNALTRIREQTPDGRGVVIGVHHTGKDGKTFRGSSAFEAGADTVYSVTRDGAVIVLNREKRKDGPRVDVHRLKLDAVEGTGSVVLGVSRGDSNGDRADILLSHYRSHFAGIGAYASQLLKVADMPEATFYRALSDLRERGDLINEGTDKRPFWMEPTK